MISLGYNDITIMFSLPIKPGMPLDRPGLNEFIVSGNGLDRYI